MTGDLREDNASPPSAAPSALRHNSHPRRFEFVGYNVIDDGRIAVITLDRPKQRNAQNRGMLVELGSAFELAEADDTVRVVILRADGPSFSAGHDLGSPDDVRERTPGLVSTSPISATAERWVESSRATGRNGTTSSRTHGGGEISGRSPSPKCTGWSSPPG